MSLLRELSRRFLGSMTGHFFLLLATGMSAAAILSLFVAEQARQRDVEAVRLESVVVSVADVAERLRRNPDRTERMLAQNQIAGAYAAPPDVLIERRDTVLEKALTNRFGPAFRPTAGRAPVSFCFPQRHASDQRAAGLATIPVPDCWIVRFSDAEGTPRSIAIGLTRLAIPQSSTFKPLYLILVVLFSAALSLLVARLAAAPVRRLAWAADRFSLSLDPEPIPERGPNEVQAALRTFNIMQRRVYNGFRERTQLLAAISHDLQTPLTRLRLRLEQVGDEPLRKRLVHDVHAMQNLVDEGLALARSAESTEEWSVVDMDSLLSCMVEDAQEFGIPVVFASGCGAAVRVKPNALSRCLSNLVDNAVKYGAKAELSCKVEGRSLIINVRDDGPGIDPDLIGAMFEPFTRGAPSQPGGRSGTGIGLTIARAQALTFGAVVSLANHPEGGIIAKVELSLDG